MKSELACINCFVKQSISVGKLATEDSELQKKIVNSTLKELCDFELSKVPVEIAGKIHANIKKISGNSDPYKAIKESSNIKAHKLLPFVTELVGESIDRALKLISIANIIDFGPFVPTEDLKGFIEKKMVEERPYPTKELKSVISSTNEILYIADNSGEIIFDLFFIEKFLSDKKVLLALRGAPILNDVSMGELSQVPSNVHIINSGSDSPGAFLPICTPEFQKLYYEVPLVISKGQGNYECLTEYPRRDLFFILIAKCPVIANSLKCNVGDLILTTH